jgi:polyhydroxyalkanoate synthase
MSESNDEHAEAPTPSERLQALGSAGESFIDPMGIVAPVAHAYLTWLMHPQELADVLTRFSNDMLTVQQHAMQRLLGMHAEPVVKPNPDDQRFSDPVWTESPLWGQYMDWYLLVTRSVQDALFKTPGLSGKERRRAAFWWRIWFNAVAPTSFLPTNPVAMRKALETRGESLMRGAQNFIEDLKAGTIRMTDPSDFKVGKNLATTPGAVVFRNRLLEVVHYTPLTTEVHQTPIVIVTPWINKFYILDLNPKKSLIQYLLKRGYSVFITSWKNPGADMRDVGFDDYLTDGIDQIVRVAREFTGSRQVHAVGYCIGGTLTATYMAWLNRRHPDPADVPVAHWTLFTTLTDFRSPGDIEVFIDEGSVRWLSNTMATRGYLDGKEMATSFRLLRANSLIWHYIVHGYLYGEKPPPFDVLYWNMDTTRMPYRMHDFYLREMYLNNNLSRKDALTIAGQPIDLTRIVQPLYSVSAVDDHIAPWRQTFRINNLAAGPKRYVLSSSGHILGIVNPPVTPPKRSYWVAEAHRRDNPEQWQQGAKEHYGSWWEDWDAWLAPQCGPMVAALPAATGAFPNLADAPGTYVLET